MTERWWFPFLLYTAALLFGWFVLGPLLTRLG